MVDEHDRPGRAAGRGFYAYEADGSPKSKRTGLWPGLADLATDEGRAVPFADLQDRFLFAEALDARQCLDEGVLRTAEDGNVGSILGIGFPAWTGGVLRFADQHDDFHGRAANWPPATVRGSPSDERAARRSPGGRAGRSRARRRSAACCSPTSAPTWCGSTGPSRPSSPRLPRPLDRGRRTVTLDLKTEAGVSALLRLAARADVLVEGYRPGVAERLGFGPADCETINPRLVYARITGWGQDGPLAARAGHDIDYIALAGALEPLGRAGERPHAPLNLIGDFARRRHAARPRRAGRPAGAGALRPRPGGRRRDGGRLGAAHRVPARACSRTGLWAPPRGENMLDGGAPFYDTYETSDGGFVAVGALEPAFYAALLDGLGLTEDAGLPAQHDRDRWPELRKRLAERFASRTRDEWAAVFADRDACVAPVLAPAEAPAHPHHRARGTFVDVGGVMQPAPAPRFGRTPPGAPRPPAAATVEDILAGWS